MTNSSICRFKSGRVNFFDDKAKRPKSKRTTEQQSNCTTGETGAIIHCFFICMLILCSVALALKFKLQ